MFQRFLIKISSETWKNYMTSIHEEISLNLTIFWLTIWRLLAKKTNKQTNKKPPNKKPKKKKPKKNEGKKILDWRSSVCARSITGPRATGNPNSLLRFLKNLIARHIYCIHKSSTVVAVHKYERIFFLKTIDLKETKRSDTWSEM